MKLDSKFALQTVLPTVVAVALLVVVATQSTGTALEEAAESSLAAITEARREGLHVRLASLQNDIRHRASAPPVVGALEALSAAFAACGGGASTELQGLYFGVEHSAGAGQATPTDREPVTACRSGYRQTHAEHDPIFRKQLATYGWADVMLVDLKGNVVYSVLKNSDFATNLLSGPWKATGLGRAAAIALQHGVRDTPVFADVALYLPAGNSPRMFLAIPVHEPSAGRVIGVLAVQIALEELDKLMRFKSGLGQTGEAFVVGTDGWMLSSGFFGNEFEHYKRQLKTHAVQRVLAGEEGSDNLVDYRGIDSLVAYRPVRPFAGALGDQPRWGVIAKISRVEALGSLSSLQQLMLLSSLFVALVAIAYGILASRRLVSPVLAMQEALLRLSKGEQAPIPGLDRTDELGAMAKAAEKFRELSESVARTRWIREQVATATTLVSQESSMARIPDIVLNFLRDRLQVPAAAFFVRNGKDDYQRAAVHGLELPILERGQTLIQQCARDVQPVVIWPVPHDMKLIATGLVEFVPEELVLYPIAHQQETLAVVEIASLRKFLPHEHALLSALMESLGLHIANTAAVERNLDLLRESKKRGEQLSQQSAELEQKNAEVNALVHEMRVQADELSVQNEEFRMNQEELLAQQQELASKNHALEVQGLELEASRQQAESRAQDLARSSQYKSQFLANMSHELRTPLNSILILAKHLSENSTAHLDADEVESASVIHESGSQLLSLINDILDLSRIEAGKLELEAEDFPVVDILTYLRRLFAPLAEKRSIGFTVDAGQADPGVIRSDRRHLIQVMTNLVSNAIKFTDNGSVRVVVEAGREEVCLHVIDSGIGIASDKIDYIFGAFQQVDGSIARKYGGTGLGLTISRQLVEMLGGHIEVESALGKGSRFSVHLPRVAGLGKAAVSAGSSASLSAADPAPRPRIAAASSAPRMTVLVVEDDKRLLPILSRLIEALGYQVKTATSAEEALAQIAAEAPDAMLLDLGLPGMSGMELLGRIKADAATAGIPVCIMSGAPDAGEARTLGATGYIRKPITRDAVSTALHLMLRATSLADQASAAPITPRLLLVEDDDAGALAVHLLFKNVNTEISRVRDGGEGLAALQSGPFDAVILDLNLPDMSGFEWLERAARETPRFPPVVVYSARDLDDAELLRLRAHADAVVSKGRLTGQTSARLREEVLLALTARRRRVSMRLSESMITKGRERHGRLLVADDDVRSQLALSKVLRAHGYDVSVAASGPLALTMLQSASFDVILSDIMMPDMDGLEFIRRLRSGSAPTTPIIAVTAKAMPGDIESCLAAGANDYLAKPVDIDRLLAQLDQWL